MMELMDFFEWCVDISTTHISFHVLDLLKGVITRLLVILNSLVPWRVFHESKVRTEAEDREFAADGQAHYEILHCFPSYFHSVKLIHATASVNHEKVVDAFRRIYH